MAIFYLGMDFEATGSDPWDKSVPVQIGITTGTEHFESLMGGWDWNEWDWNEEAANVHKIPRETIDKADPVWKVDIRVAAWLLDQGWRNRMFTVPVGFNVACMTPDHRVLMADLTWQPMGDLEPGDKLMAWNEPVNGSRRTWAESVVLSNRFDTAPVYAVEFNDGQVIFTTAEHPWLAPRHNNGHGYKWRRTESLGDSRSGLMTPLLHVTEQDRSWEAGWLSGMFDGEGTLESGGWDRSRRAGLRFSIAQNPGPVYEQAKSYLNKLGFRFTASVRTGREDHRCHDISILGGKYEGLRLLQVLRPVRFLDKFVPSMLGALKPGDLDSRPESKRVVDVRYVGEKDITRLMTSTETYVAEGFGMHNSYDRQFVTRWMPNLNRLLSYRSVDLNTLIFARAGDNEEKYNGIKKAAKKWAQAQLSEGGTKEEWHDGLYDAKAALKVLEYLRHEGVIDGTA